MFNFILNKQDTIKLSTAIEKQLEGSEGIIYLKLCGQKSGQIKSALHEKN